MAAPHGGGCRAEVNRLSKGGGIHYLGVYVAFVLCVFSLWQAVVSAQVAVARPEPATARRSVVVAEIRDYYYNERQDTMASYRRDPAEFPQCSAVCPKKPGGATASASDAVDPCLVPCQYNRTFLTNPQGYGAPDLTYSGIRADGNYGFGLYDTTPYGDGAYNYIMKYWYTYIPARGQKEASECDAIGEPAGCSYKPGELNPGGLRRINAQTGYQELAPTIGFVPIFMHWDLLSASLVMLTKGWPADNPATTPDGRPILSLVGLNETTGQLFEEGDPVYIQTDTVPSVTFCRTCPTGPTQAVPQTLGQVVINLPFDYTDAVTSGITFDSFSQTMYMILFNSHEQDSHTLIGVSRQTDLTPGSFTNPRLGRWKISIIWEAFQYYMWPRELQNVMYLDFAPRMTELSDSRYQPVEGFRSQALFALVNMKEKTGPCSYKNCGSNLKRDEVALHNLDPGCAQTQLGCDVLYSLYNPVRCPCPAVIVRININPGNLVFDGNVMELGNVDLDTSGNPYTIISYLDQKYEAPVICDPLDNTTYGITCFGNDYEAVRWARPPQTPPLTEDLSIKPAVSLQSNVGAFRAMQPEDAVEQIPETSQRLLFVQSEVTDQQALSDGLSKAESQGRDSKLKRHIDVMWMGTDLEQEFDLEEQWQLNHPPTFMYHDLRDSRAIEQYISFIYPLKTDYSRSYVYTSSGSGTEGVEFGEYRCPVKPWSCDECAQNETDNIINSFPTVTITNDQEFREVSTDLYNSGLLPYLLFKETPESTDRYGNIVPVSYNFECPRPCDEYTCDECAQLFKRPCSMYATAGVESSSFLIQAVNTFGYRQLNIDDNFTVTITGPGFPSDPSENPAEMPTERLRLGAVRRDATKDGGALGEVISNPFASLWEFPNYHDMGNRQEGVLMMPEDQTYPAECNTAALPIDDVRRRTYKCLRNLARPRTSGQGLYRVNFGLDRAGEYTLSVTFKGQLQQDEAGNELLGPHIKGSPYILTILPGPTQAMFTSVTGPALTELTVGELSYFTITARDIFGNRRTEGGDLISVVLKGAEYVRSSLPHDPSLPQFDTLDSRGRLNFRSYSNITDHEDGSYTVWVYVTKRIREQPTYSLEVLIKQEAIPEGPWEIIIRQGITDAYESFAVYEQGAAPIGTFSTNGLDLAIAGEAAIFSVQARDRFQNLQDVYATGQPGDPFFVSVTDILGFCGYDHAGRELASVGTFSVIPPNCNSLESDPRGQDMLEPVPEVLALTMVTPHASITFTGEKGFYTVIYKAYKVGNATVGVQLYNEHIGPVPGAPDGTTGSPFTVIVSAGPTWPANCIAYGPALDGFTAGEVGAQGRGVSYILQLRDKYGNNRTEAEAAYIEGGTDDYPWPTFRLNLACTEAMQALNDGRCEGILQRDTDNGAGEDGIRRFIYEVPIREGGAVVYSPVDSTADISKTMDYIGGGRFETTFTSDLAGQFDMQIRMKLVDLDGFFIPNQLDAVMGSDGQQGTASYFPYMAPFPIIVEPGPVDLRLTELFQWDDGIFYSTLHGKTHRFRVHLPNDPPDTYTSAQPLDELFGTAGQPGTFYMQLRDEYGNLIQNRLDDVGALDVNIIGQRNGELIYLGTEASPNIPELNYMGFGIYAVRFFSSESALYTVRIEVEGVEVKKIQQDQITLRWRPGNGFYQLRIRPSVTSPAMCEAYGPGLRGAQIELTTTIHIVAKDNLGNTRDETGQEQVEEASRFYLFMKICDNPTEESCQAEFITQENTDGSLLSMSQTQADLANPGQYIIEYSASELVLGGAQTSKYLMIEIRYGSSSAIAVPIRGPTDVEAANGQLLSLVRNPLLTPTRVFAQVSNDIGDPDMSKTRLTHINGRRYPGQYSFSRCGERTEFLIQVRSDSNFDYTQGDTLHELCIRIARNNEGVRLGTEDVPVEPPVNVIYMCMTTTPSENGVFVDNNDGTYSIILPYLVGLDDPQLENDLARGSSTIIPDATYEWRSNIVLMGTHTIDITGIDTTTFDHDSNSLPERLYKMPITSGMIHLPAPTHQEFVVVQFEYIGGQLVPVDQLPLEYRYTNPVEGNPDGLRKGAGESIELKLTSYDRFFNKQVWTPLLGGDVFEVRMTRPAGGEGSLVFGEVEDLALSSTAQEKGSYRASITQELRGEYELALLLNGDPDTAVSASDGTRPRPSPLFAGSAPNYFLFTVITPGAKDPTQCYATTDTGLAIPLALLTVGESFTMVVEERDRYGNRRDTITVDEFTEEPVYFDFTFVPVDPELAHRAYTAPKAEPGSGPPRNAQAGALPLRYILAPADDSHSVTVLAGGNGTSTTRPYIAGKFTLSITDNGQHISGSPMEVSFRADSFAIDRTVVFGPGVNFNNSNPGTVRSGVPTEVYIQTRDKYDNDLPEGGLQWSVSVDPITGGTLVIGEVAPSNTGLYEATYIPNGFVGYAVLETSLDGQKVPTQRYVWQDEDKELHPRASNVVGESGYPNDVILDFITISSLTFPEQPFGVVVDILPGLTSEVESYAYDDVGTILGNTLGSEPGTDDRLAWPHQAGDEVKMRIQAYDVYGLPKTDEDEERDFECKLYYTSDNLGQVGVNMIRPWVGTGPQPSGLAERWYPSFPVWRQDQRFWTMNVSIVKDMTQPDSNVFIPLENPSPAATSLIMPQATGWYRLDCYLRFWEKDDNDIWFVKNIEALGKNDNTSPYVFRVISGDSDGAASQLQGETNTTVSRRRRLLSPMELHTVPNGPDKRRRLLSPWAEEPAWDWDGEPVPKATPIRRALASDLNGPVYTDDLDAGPAGVSAWTEYHRRVLVEGAAMGYDFRVEAGVEVLLRLSLMDQLGNKKEFNDRKRLDTFEVTFGTALRERDDGEGGVLPGEPCVWEAGLTARYAPRLDRQLSPPGCTLTHLNYARRSDGTVVPPIYTPSVGNIPGIGLQISNDYVAAEFQVVFRTDRQFPATPYGVYMLEAILNGKPLMGSPFAVRVDPGPVYGPNCEIVGLTAETGDEVLEATVATDFELEVIARDRFGNRHAFSDRPENWVIEMVVVKGVAAGQSSVVKGCTDNLQESTGDCQFTIDVRGEPEGELTDGNYTISLNTVIASEAPTGDSGLSTGKHQLSIRFCLNINACTAFDNVYNPLPGGLNPFIGNFEPLPVTVLPGPTVARMCTAFGNDILEGGLVGVEAVFQVEARDQYGNRRLSGGDVFEVMVYPPSSNVDISKTNMEDGPGIYVGSFMPQVVGIHNILISLKPRSIDSPREAQGAIQGSPFSPNFRNEDGLIRPESSRLINSFGSELSNFPRATAGEDLEVLLQAYTCPLPLVCIAKRTGGDVFRVRITEPGGDMNQTVDVVDHSEPEHNVWPTYLAGRYSFTLDGMRDFQRAGTYQVDIRACKGSLVEGECDEGHVPTRIKPSRPFQLVVRPSQTDASRSFARELRFPPEDTPPSELNNGEGWRAGELLTFTIQARDRFGNDQRYDPSDVYDSRVLWDVNITGDGGRFATTTFQQVTVASPAELQDGRFQVEHSGDGYYLVMLRSLASQHLLIRMSLNDIPLANDGATVTVLPGYPSIPDTILTQPITRGSTGESRTLYFATRDAYGNMVTEGGIDFRVSLNLLDSIAVSGNGDNPLTATDKVKVEFEENEFNELVQVFKRDGTYYFDHNFKITASVDITDVGDGSYRVRYRSDQAGRATLAITHLQFDTDLGGSVETYICRTPDAVARCSNMATVIAGRIQLFFEPIGPSATHSIVRSDQGILERTSAGVRSTFTIEAYDSYGNRQTRDGYTFVAALRHLDSPADQPRVVPCDIFYRTGDGTTGPGGSVYVAQFTAQVQGRYSLSVTRQGKQLQNDQGIRGPFEPLTVVPGVPSGERTTIDHPAGKMTVIVDNVAVEQNVLEAEAGEVMTFSIEARDLYNNRIRVGGESFIITIGLLEEGRYEDNGDGTYLGIYTVTSSGVFDLRVRNDQEIVRNPLDYFDTSRQAFRLHVLPGPISPAFCTVYGGGMQGVTAGYQGIFYVQAVDIFGNKITTGGNTFAAFFTQAFLDEETGSFVDRPSLTTIDASDDGNGRYTFTYLTNQPGNYNLTVTLELNGEVETVYSSAQPELNEAVRAIPVVVTPDLIDASLSRVALDSLTEITVGGEGSTGSMLVRPKDSYGNNVTNTDTDGWTVVIATGSGTLFDFTRTEIEPRFVARSYPGEDELAAWRYANPSLLDVSRFFELTYDVGLSAGLFEGMITLRGAQIRGSPFSFRVDPGPVGANTGTGDVRRHPHRCTAGFNRCSYISGLGLEEGVLFSTSGTGRPIHIHMRDIYGNDIEDPTGVRGLETISQCADAATAADCPFRVILSSFNAGVNVTSVPGWAGGLSGQSVAITPLEGGLLRVDLVFRFIGDFGVFVSLHTPEDQDFLEPIPTFGLAIGQSPAFPTAVRATPDDFRPADASESYVDGDGLMGAMAGEEGVFIIHAVKTVCVDGGVVIALTDGECLGRLEARAAPGGGETFEVSLAESDPTGSEVNVSQPGVTDVGDGSYTVRYSLTRAGEYLLNVRLDGSRIRGFQARLKTLQVLPGETDPAQSTIEGIPANYDVYVGVRVTFLIIARDRFGNNQVPKDSQLLPDVFEVDISLASEDPRQPGVPVPPLTVDQRGSLVTSTSVTDNQNGTFLVLYSSRRAGLFDVSVYYSGKTTVNPETGLAERQIVDSKSQRIESGIISAAYSRLTGPLNPSSGGYLPVAEVFTTLQADSPLLLVVHAFDRFNNSIISGGEASLMYLQVDTPDNKPPDIATIVDNRDGTYNMLYTPTLTGTYILTLVIQGFPVLPIIGSSYTASGTIRQVLADASRSFVIGSGATGATAGKSQRFEIQSVDKSGQVKAAGGDRFKVELTPLETLNTYGEPLEGGDSSVCGRDLYPNLCVVDQSSLVGLDPDAVPGRYSVSYTVRNFGEYRLEITLYDQHIQGSPFNLTVVPQDPPLQRRAPMSNSGTEISVEFEDRFQASMPTNRANIIGLVPCNILFADNSTELLGDGSKCAFVRDDKLTIYLGNSALVVPGNQLFFRPGIITNSQRNSLSVRGGTVVDWPEAAATPKSVIRAAKRLSRCQDLVVDMSGSYGTAGRPLNYTYGIFPNVPNDNAISDMLFGWSQQQQIDTISLPVELFEPGVEYRFAIYVTSFLRVYQRREHLVTRIDAPIPAIQVQGDPILQVFRDTPVYIRSDVEMPVAGLPECILPTRKLEFRWLFDLSRTEEGFPLDPTTRFTNTLYIPPATLTAGESYFFNIMAEVPGYPDLWNMALAQVDVKYSPLKVVLIYKKEIDEFEDFVVNATASVDPDDMSPSDPVPPFGPFTFKWECAPWDEARGNYWAVKSCFRDDYGLLVIDETQKYLVIPAGQMAPGKYLFSVTIAKEPTQDTRGPISGRFVNRFIEVVVTDSSETSTPTGVIRRRGLLQDVEEDPATYHKPEVTIAPPPESINVQDRLTLLGNVEMLDIYRQYLTFQWSVTEGILNISAPNVLLSSRNGLNLVVSGGHMSVGEIYSFRLDVYNNVSGYSGWDEATVTINAPPSSGRFIITPLEGYASQTPFRLKLENWEDDGVTPVKYELRYVDPATGGSVPLVSRTATNEFTSVIPPVSRAEDGYEITILAYIVDQHNAKAEVSRTIVLRPPDIEIEQSTWMCLEQTSFLDLDGCGESEKRVRVQCEKATAPTGECPCNVDPLPDAYLDAVEQWARVANSTRDTQTGEEYDVWIEMNPVPELPEGYVWGRGNGTHCTYYLEGASALAYTLVQDNLEYAIGTGNAAILLTLGKAVAMLNDMEAERRAERGTIEMIPGARKSPAMLRQETKDLLNARAAVNMLNIVMSATRDALQRLQFTEEEIDHCQDTLAYTTRDPETLGGEEDTSAALADGLLLSLGASRDLGITIFAASQGTQALSNLAGLKSSMSSAAVARRRRSLRRRLLQGGSSASDAVVELADASALAQEEARAMSYVLGNATDSLATAGIKGAVPGETPFEVTSANIQIGARVTTNPRGAFSSPPPEGDVNGESPVFELPADGSLTEADEDVEVVAITNQKSPFEGIRVGNPRGDLQQNMQGAVATFELRQPGGALKNVSLDPMVQTPIQFRIPLQISASACRKTQGGCRFWDPEAAEWSDEGLVEIMRTETYVVCETTHLSSFGISADDILPEFNLVNPITDLDLFSTLELQNALAVFVVAFLIAGFAALNFIGYRRDCRDRSRAKLEAKVSHIDSRLTRGNMELALKKSGNMALVLPDKPTQALGAGKGEKEGLESESGTFMETLGTAMTKEHDVTQVLSVQPDDPFTRPQRLMVILCLVLGQTAVAAVFFGIDPSNISAKILIGIFTAVLLLPSNFLFKILFKKSIFRPPPDRKRRGRRERPPRRPRAHGPLQRHRITVYTSRKFSAGTDSNVMITVYGSRGDSGPIKLPATKASFEAGSVDVFDVEFPYLGAMDKVMIGHDGGGRGSGWHLDRVVVRNTVAREGAVFPCGAWLDKRLDGGLLTRVLDIDFERTAAEVDWEDVDAESEPGGSGMRSGDSHSSATSAVPPPPPKKKSKRRVTIGPDDKPGTPIGSDSEGEGSPKAQPAGGGGGSTDPPLPTPSSPAPAGSQQGPPQPPLPLSGVPRPPRRRFRRAVGMYANYVGQGYIGLMPPQQAFGPGGAVASPGAFVPPPPPPGAEGRMRPRRKRGSSVGTPSTGVMSPGGLGAVPPPPLPAGSPVRPRRRSVALIGYPGAASPPDSLPLSLHTPISASSDRPPSSTRPAVMRDQFGAVIPGQAPPSPPHPADGAPHTSGGRRGRRARAAMLAQFGGNTVTPFAGGGSVEVGQPGAPPPPPPPLAGPVRPRRRRASATSSTATSGVASLRASVTSTVPADSSSLAPTGRPRRRPGAGRTGRNRLQPLAIMGPDGGLMDPTRPLAPPGMQIASKNTRQARVKRALGALRGEEIGFDDEAFQVPEAIESVVIKIQRAWKRKMLIRRRRQRLAVTRIQAWARGFMARQYVRKMREQRATGRRPGQLWWVHAHSMIKGAPRLAAPPHHKFNAKGVTDNNPFIQQWMGGASNKKIMRDTLRKSQVDKEHEAKTKREEQRALRRRARRRQALKRRQRSAGLPRWFIYVTYIMAFAFCAVASLMIILYGLYFEPAVARAWLLSSVFAACVEIFVQQPVKIAALTTLKERVKREVKAFRDRKKKGNEEYSHMLGPSLD